VVDLFREVIRSQYEAALCVVDTCVRRCPESVWQARVGHFLFNQVAFHTVFFADLYLERSEAEFKRQPFHVDNGHIFRRYEELGDEPPKETYDVASVRSYIGHCRRKAADVAAAETEQSLKGPSGFPWRKCSRAELHVYNIRHIQHHAAQLSLRLRLDTGIDIPWIAHGWRDT
jgi:DinB superfamily